MERMIFVLWKITLAVAWGINRKGQTGSKVDAEQWQWISNLQEH